MGAKPVAGGGRPVQRQTAPAAPSAERKKKPGAKTASRYAGALSDQRQEDMANVARKKLLGQ